MKPKKIIASAAILLSLAGIVTPLVVSANTWEYGYGVGTAYSNYYAGQHGHGSRVVNRNNGTTDTSNAIAGVWSRASIIDLWDPASFYYSDSYYA
jgi:lactococcin 972 family bacteriocin